MLTRPLAGDVEPRETYQTQKSRSVMAEHWCCQKSWNERAKVGKGSFEACHDLRNLYGKHCHVSFENCWQMLQANHHCWRVYFSRGYSLRNRHSLLWAFGLRPKNQRTCHHFPFTDVRFAGMRADLADLPVLMFCYFGCLSCCIFLITRSWRAKIQL